MDGFQNPKQLEINKKNEIKTPLQQKLDDKQKILDTTNLDQIQNPTDDIKKVIKDKDRTEDIKIKKKFSPWELITRFIKGNQDLSTKDMFADEPDREIDGISIPDLIAPIDMEIDFTHIQMGDLYYRTLVVIGYPRYVGANWLSSLINFDHALRISTFYYPVDSKAILDKLKRKIAEMEATLYAQMEGHKVLDPKIKVALNDAQTLQDSIAAGSEKFFHYGLYITISAKSLEELEKISKNISSTLAAGSITAVPALLQQEQGFISTQPLGMDQIQTTRNMDTTALARTFPFVTSELTMDKGILYGLNLHNNSLVIFDRFSLENANSVIFAKSGAGKSYFVKLEAIRSLMFGTEIIIIDPEKEYQRLCEAVGGSYISFSQDKGHKMNPFELSGMGDPDDDELRMKILSLQGFFKILFGGLNNIEQAILDRALLLTYREKGITLDPKTQRDNEPPLLEDLYKVLKGMAEPEARELSKRLEQYIIGSGTGIFNEKSNVSIDNSFTVFSTRDLQEEIRPIAMYLMLDYIWTRIRKDRKRRLLIVDEAWYMMQNEDSANFMYSIAKRARKYYLGITTVTQEVEDFAKHEKGQAIINNASMQFLMKQSNTASRRLQEVFELSEGERQYLVSCTKGQGIFFAGQNHVAMQVISSVNEHDLITSDPKELEVINKREKQPQTVEELGQIFAPPTVLNPLLNKEHEVEDTLHDALENKKSVIQQIFNERIENSTSQTNNPKENKGN